MRSGPVGFVIIAGIASILLRPVLAGLPARPPGYRVAESLSFGPATLSHVQCTVGTAPQYATYDPVNHEVYVTNAYVGATGGTVSVINGTCTVFATISLPTGAQPRGVGFDDSNDMVYVVDFALTRST
jgi:hypothetical protein